MTGYYPVQKPPGSDVELEDDIELKEPNMWKIILINDDFTSQDFVVKILVEIFYKPMQEAINIMMSVHKSGRGVAGIYSKEIAESKIAQAKKWAEDQEFPLQMIMEEDI